MQQIIFYTDAVQKKNKNKPKKKKKSAVYGIYLLQIYFIANDRQG